MDVTQILHAAQDGDPQAREDLIAAVYNDLKRLARGKMGGERMSHTLSSTALVHEVVLGLLDAGDQPGDNRKQFFKYASTAMRHLLIDHARKHASKKRGGGAKRVVFEEAVVASESQSDDLLALNEALKQLADVEPRKAQVVEMRYFGGLSNEEVAEALDISIATVKRDWSVAQGFLLQQLRQEGTG